MNEQEIKELVEQLRGPYRSGGTLYDFAPQAADVIERLQDELRAKDEQIKELLDKYEKHQSFGHETVSVQQVIWDIEKAKGETK